MKKNILIWGAAVILIVIAVYFTNKNKSNIGNTNVLSSAPQILIGSSNSSFNQDSPVLIDAKSRQKAADFTLTDLDGNRVSLKDLQGKDVYINFWATWCPWCKKELPDIEKIYQGYKDKNLVVLTVDIGEDKTTVSNFMKENNFNFNVLLDSSKSVAQQYGISSIPVSIFIDKNGKVSQKRVGAMTEDQMKTIIDNMLADN
jgi:peroxiredoxin